MCSVSSSLIIHEVRIKSWLLVVKGNIWNGGTKSVNILQHDPCSEMVLVDAASFSVTKFLLLESMS